MRQNDLKITVAIPCFNGAENIGSAIESMLRQRRLPDEIIVIDDGSTDNSSSIIEKYPVRLIKHNNNLGLATARNTAWQSASGDIIVYIDADAVADEKLLELILEEYENNNIVGVGGQSIELYIPSIFNRWRALFHNQSLGLKRIEEVSMLAGLCSSYRKDVLIKIGGFDGIYKTHAEDVDIGTRFAKNNYQLLYNPAIKVYHKRNDTLGSLYKYVYRHIYWACISRRKNGTRTLVKFTLGAISFGVKATVKSLFRYKSISLALLSIAIIPIRFYAALFGSLKPIIKQRKKMTNKINILMLNLSDMAHTLYGGQEKRIFNLVKNLDRERFNITIILPEEGEAKSQYEKMGMDVISLPLRSKFTIFYTPKLIKIIKYKKIDIVHTHEPRSNLLGFIATRFAPVEHLIATRYDVYLSKYMGKFQYINRKFHMEIDKFVFRFFDRIIAISKAVEDELIKLQHLPFSKVRLIYYGLDMNYFPTEEDKNRVRKEFGLTNEIKSIGLVARLIKKKKGQEFFLDVARHTQHIIPNAKFFLVGAVDKKTKNYFDKLTKVKRLNGSVIFTGHRQDALSLTSVFDVLVLPSLWEAFGRVIWEAMELGTPVVGTNVGGIREIIDSGINGLLVPPADSPALANAIIKILCDETFAKKISRAGKEKAAYFRENSDIKEIELIYFSG